MIERWLLNAEAFFGKYPFPTVAYNEADLYAPLLLARSGLAQSGLFHD